MVRSIVAKTQQLVLLAPEYSRIPTTFLDVGIDYDRHQELLAEMQRMRGRLYLHDGAIEPWELSTDGRHQTPADEESWHLLALDSDGHVCGCARYREHCPADPYSKLSVAASPLANSSIWESHLYSAVSSEIALARSLDFAFVEVGGWALTDEFRSSPEAIKIALSAYSLARTLGGCIGITTATVRHSSASILRRIGGQMLQSGGVEIPTYFDPRYKCQMVILRFDSSAPNPRYSMWVDELEACLPFTQVLSPPPLAESIPDRYRYADRRMRLPAWTDRHTNFAETFRYPSDQAKSVRPNLFRSTDALQPNQSGD
jgi:hypothetical protein